MAALADRMTVAGPRPKELWLTLGLSIVLHGLLMAVIILMPRFRLGTYVHVPVSYTVDLVSATPGGRPAPAAPARAAAAPAKAPAAPTARPAPPVAAPRAAPPPPPVPSSEELTLPGKRTARKAPAEVEPSLRPPSVAGKETLRPAPADARPRLPAPSPPAPVVAQAPAAASVAPAAPATGTAEAGPTKASGVELAGGERGDGSGGSALGYYLDLVDYKISTNWNPVATGGARESVVIVRFRVLRSGNVRNVELETGSGDAGLDNAALRAIRQSIPLPPFPNLLTEPYLDLRYTFVMERG